MKKKVLKGAAVAALGGLVALSLASCNSAPYKDEVIEIKSKEFEAPKNWKAPEVPDYNASVTDGGSVVNIRVWNDEFISRFKDYYPNVTEVKKNEEYTIPNPSGSGTLTVKFQMTSNQNNAYQMALDTALAGQSKAAADDKVDIFLLEADYALKYVNDNVSVDVADLGITEADTANMYKYTKDVATSKGRLKALSWQATPGLFAYRTDIAEAVLGTSDPVEVQKKLADWNKFDEVAAKMKEKGYNMLSGYDDAYRVFSNNLSKPLVDSATGKITIDSELVKWIKQTKDYTNKGYNKGTSLWDDAWSAEQTAAGTTFGFFYSTWGINFTLEGNAKVDKNGKNLTGKYRVCEGPASYFWGGTWLAAANGSDNKTAVADIMRKLTCDKAIAKKITLDTQDYTNNKEAMNELANDPTYGSAFLGGQNHIKLFASAADKIKMDKTTKWDQGINENLQHAMIDVFNGKISLEEGYKTFYTQIKTLYPEFE